MAMGTRLRWCSLSLACGAAACVATPHPASMPKDVAQADRVIVHMLNRVTFGARPAYVDRVRTAGIGAYVDEQLHPDRIRDERLEARLQDLRALAISPRAFATEYYQPMTVARQEF